MKNILNRMNDTLDELDNLISELENSRLSERIEVNGNKASVVIDQFETVPLLRNLKRVLSISKNFIKDIFENRFIQNKYLKFFRLISEDTSKTATHAAKKLCNDYWNQKVSFNILMNGKEIIDKMISEVNETITFLNSKIKFIPEKIKSVPDIGWVYVRHRLPESKEIKLLNFKEIYQLREKKDHIIKKLSNLSDNEKEILINAYNKRPDLESKIKINWQDKNLRFEDFNEVINAFNSESKTQIKKAAASGELSKYFVGKEDDFDIILETEDKLFAKVNSHAGAVYADSFKCNGQGAKWCIGYEANDHHWKSYSRSSLFVLVLFKKEINELKKVMLQLKMVKDPIIGVVFEMKKCWVPSDRTTSPDRFVSKEEFKILLNYLSENYPNKVRQKRKNQIKFEGELLPIEEIINLIIDTFNREIENDGIILIDSNGKWNSSLGTYDYSFNALKKVTKSRFIIKHRPSFNQYYVKLQSGIVSKTNNQTFIDDFANYGINYVVEKESNSPGQSITGDEFFINEHIENYVVNPALSEGGRYGITAFINCEIDNLKITYTTKSDYSSKLYLTGMCKINNLTDKEVNLELLKKAHHYEKWDPNLKKIVDSHTKGSYKKLPSHAVILFQKGQLELKDNTIFENSFIIVPK